MNTRTGALTLLFAGLLLMSSHVAYAADNAMPTRDLSMGARGTDVTWLQQYLISDTSTSTAFASLRTAGATGYFGPRTRAALAEFQKTHSILPAQGYFGPKTRAALSSMTVLPSPAAANFTGTIEAVDTGCFADGVCSVTISGKKVILEARFRVPPLPPRGELKGVGSVGDLETMIGKPARVYAATTTDAGAEYTLYGSTDYYVEVLANVTNPTISSITPASGPAGTKVTITGSGFTPFSQVGIGKGAFHPTEINAAGTQMTFAMPSSTGVYCKRGQACILLAMLLTPGTYDMNVLNEDGGMSNAVQFTLTGPKEILIN